MLITSAFRAIRQCETVWSAIAKLRSSTGNAFVQSYLTPLAPTTVESSRSEHDNHNGSHSNTNNANPHVIMPFGSLPASLAARLWLQPLPSLSSLTAAFPPGDSPSHSPSAHRVHSGGSVADMEITASRGVFEIEPAFRGHLKGVVPLVYGAQVFAVLTLICYFYYIS